MDFEASFSYSFKRFSPLVFEPNTSIQKESLSRVFKSDFLVFSTTTSILIFFSQSLELFIAIPIPIGIFVVRGFEVIKVFRSNFALRRRTCVFAVFRVLVRALCRGTASASLRACGVLFLREQERD